MEVTKSTALYPLEDEIFWKTHLESFKQSGLTRKEYCRQNNVNYDRFGYWLPKLAPRTTSLVAVQLKPETRSRTQPELCTLALKNGHELKIHDLQALSLIIEKVCL